MNMKNIIALAGVAVAAVASASTNYVRLASRNRDLVATVRLMSRDPALSSPAAFRTALEDLDRSSATSRVPFNVSTLSRRCPLAAPAAAPNAGLPPAAAAPAAAAAGAILPEAAEARPATAAAANVLPVAARSGTATVGRLPVYQHAAEASGCSPGEMLRKRFLSAPWSASRRLEAARRRGDAEEAHLMEAALKTYTLEALAPSAE